MSDWTREQYEAYRAQVDFAADDAKIMVTKARMLSIVDELLKRWPTDPPVDSNTTPE